MPACLEIQVIHGNYIITIVILIKVGFSIKVLSGGSKNLLIKYSIFYI